MPPDPVSRPAPALPVTGLLGAGAVALVAAAVAIQPLPPPTAAPASRCPLAPPGFLVGQLYGDLETALDWRGDRLRCEGMLRGEDGLRLMFGGPVAGQGGDVVLVIGIAGTLAGLPGNERPANVTLIDERSGRFYATGGLGRCWTLVSDARPVGAGQFRVAGTLYCAGALPALRDSGSVTLGDLRYAGRLVVE
jgi:hypothetical protein